MHLRRLAALTLLLPAAALAQATPATDPVLSPEAPAPELSLQAPPAPKAAALRRVPVDLSLFPPLSLNGDGKALNHLSIGLAAARSTVLEGVAIASLHWAEEDVTGVQVTYIAASAGGMVRGVQLSNVTNVAGALQGVQATSVVNVVRGGAAGLQAASVTNVALARLSGVQVAAGFNLGREISGVQAATVNWAVAARGLQLAVVNVGGEVSGAQIGVVNVARRVRGLQLGVLNLSEEADASVGVASLVRDGRHDVEVYATEIATLNAGLRLGGRTLHGVLVAGVEPGEQREVGRTRWVTGLGMGGGVALGRRFGLDADLLAETVRYDAAEPRNVLASARVLVAWRASPWMALFAGPTANVLVSKERQPDLDHLGWKLGHGSREVRGWAGFAAGLRL